MTRQPSPQSLPAALRPATTIDTVRSSFHIQIRRQKAQSILHTNRKKFFQLMLSSQEQAHQLQTNELHAIGFLALQSQSLLKSPSTAAEILRYLVRLRKTIRKHEDKSYKVFIDNKAMYELVQMLHRVEKWSGTKKEVESLKKHGFDILANVSKSYLFGWRLVFDTDLLDLCLREYKKEAGFLAKSICYVVGNALLAEGAGWYAHEHGIVHEMLVRLDFDEQCEVNLVSEMIWVVNNYMNSIARLEKIELTSDFCQDVIFFSSNILYVFNDFQDSSGTLGHTIDVVHKVMSKSMKSKEIAVPYNRIVDILIRQESLGLPKKAVKQGLEILNWALLEFKDNENVFHELINSERYKLLLIEESRRNEEIVLRSIYNLLDHTMDNMLTKMCTVLRLLFMKMKGDGEKKFPLLEKYFMGLGREFDGNDRELLREAEGSVVIEDQEKWDGFWKKVRGERYEGTGDVKVIEM